MKRFVPRLTYANVVSTLCLFLLLGGGAAWAATHLGKNSVGARQLKKGAVTSVKVKNGTLQLGDFKAAERAKLVGPAGSPGTKGRTRADWRPRRARSDECRGA